MSTATIKVGSARAEEALFAVLDDVIGRDLDLAGLSSELFAVAALFDGQPSLRRTLTEPSVPAQARARMADALFAPRVSAAAVELVTTAVTQRWSRGSDVADALEKCSVTAAAAMAEKDGTLDALEDELFRFGRILQATPSLRDTLSDRTASRERRRALLDDLLSGKVTALTSQLLGQLLDGRRRTFATGIADYQVLAAAYRKRMIATVWVASPLSDDQKTRLAASLAKEYSHAVHLNVVVDPSVLGGVRVAIGDDVIDSTVETRLSQAQRLIR